MCSLKLPPQVIKQIDIYRKYYLWSKGDINRRGTCLVAWEEACKTKAEGGLGIINIKTQNEALLLKFLDKFVHKKDLLTPPRNYDWRCSYTALDARESATHNEAYLEQILLKLTDSTPI